MSDFINVSLGPVTWLTLNRPATRNAFHPDMMKALLSALQTCAQDTSVRVVVLNASGKHFSAGADLNWMQESLSKTPEENREDAEVLEQLFYTLAHFPKPTVASIHGASFGGAVGLIAACDMAIAATDAIFCLSEVTLGLLPAVISPYLARAMGPRQALKIALTAERFDAQQALTWGLVHDVVDGDALQEKTNTLAQSMLSHGPEALSKTKALFHTLAPIDDHIRHTTLDAIATQRQTDEAQSRLQSFFENRTSS